MTILRVQLENGVLTENYKVGMQKMLPLPIRYASDFDRDQEREFFAYLTTLGGGFVNGDDYFQSFTLNNTKAAIRSQSNQKVYKGTSQLTTRLYLDESSVLMFHNDANIFYPTANFYSQTKLFAKQDSKFFYLDGGFIGYAEGQFSANLTLRVYIDGKLWLNDVFAYNYDETFLNSLFNHQYFYTVVIRENMEIPSVHNDQLKAHVSTMGNMNIIRIASDSNDIAMKYIEEIKVVFLTQNEMTLISAS